MKLNLNEVRFLTEENEQLERKIIARIEQVVSEILNHFKGVVSIVLIGTLGRGEGIWKVDNGVAKLTSDLDLLVVTQTGRTLPKALKYMNYEREVEIPLTINLATYRNLKRRRKDTYSMDIKTQSRVIWGENVIKDIPEVKKEEIGFKDIVSLFFNRILFSTMDFLPGDLMSTNRVTLARLSHEASRLISTCADMISIVNGNYTPSTLARLKIAKEAVERGTIAIEIDKQEFLSLLNKTIEFNSNRNSLYIEDIDNYWFNSRRYLLNIFLALLGKEYPGVNIFEAPFLVSESSKLPFKHRAYLWYQLFKLGKLPNFSVKVNPIACWRKAILMLYLAIERDKLVEDYLKEAEQCLGKIYWRRKTRGSIETRWVGLRDELRKLRFEYVFI